MDPASWRTADVPVGGTRGDGASRLWAVERHLTTGTTNCAGSSSAAGPAAASAHPAVGPADPYPDLGDYRGKSQPFQPKPALGGSGGTASAAPASVLTPEDHDHFLRTGFIHLKGIIPPASVAQALENIQQPKPDCTRLHAAVRELLGPYYTLNIPATAGGYDMPRALLSPTEEPEKYAAALRASASDTVVTHGGSHCDDAYGTLMPQGWVLGSFIFLTPVETRGGAFIVYPGSYVPAPLHQPIHL